MKETNFEYYENEIKRLGVNCFAVVNGEVTSCIGTDCILCSFNCLSEDDDCDFNKTDWLYEEYNPHKLTQRETHLLEYVERGWIARDSDNELWWYEEKPSKAFLGWAVEFASHHLIIDGENILTFIQWEDGEPWSVEDLRKLEVKE